MFKRIDSANISGSSLWFELPNATNKQMKELFGTGFASQDNQKYSDTILIQSEMTGLQYTLYKCFGVWRVGRWTKGTVIQIAYDRSDLEIMFA